MSLTSTIIPNQIHTIDGQPYDGFTVLIPDDAEFEGTYHFTESFTHMSALELIFSGDALNPDDNEVNQ
jgi:hypothetical protein